MRRLSANLNRRTTRLIRSVGYAPVMQTRSRARRLASRAAAVSCVLWKPADMTILVSSARGPVGGYCSGESGEVGLMADVLPNLFIIGAPKCGTSSLHFYLDQH